MLRTDVRGCIFGGFYAITPLLIFFFFQLLLLQKKKLTEQKAAFVLMKMSAQIHMHAHMTYMYIPCRHKLIYASSKAM